MTCYTSLYTSLVVVKAGASNSSTRSLTSLPLFAAALVLEGLSTTCIVLLAVLAALVDRAGGWVKSSLSEDSGVDPGVDPAAVAAREAMPAAHHALCAVKGRAIN